MVDKFMGDGVTMGIMWSEMTWDQVKDPVFYQVAGIILIPAMKNLV